MEGDTNPQSSSEGMIYQVDTAIDKGSPDTVINPNLLAQPTATEAAKPLLESIYSSNSTLVFVRDN